MKAKSRQSGITLTEMTVVIAVVALLVSLGLPAARMLFNSFESQSGARAMISAAMASARAIAAKEQRYVGVRFQKAYDPTGPLRAHQYMIFIIFEEPRKMGNLRTGFRAVDGLEPIKLPDSVGIMDFRLIKDRININANWEPGGDPELTDLTSFSIVFSPSGKLVIHDVRVRNRDGRTEGTQTTTISSDDIFNTQSKITDPVAHVGMFIQDDYPPFGLQEESSRNSFIIYEEEKFRQTYKNGRAWSDYLRKLVPEYINPYTGTMIER